MFNSFKIFIYSSDYKITNLSILKANPMIQLNLLAEMINEDNKR